MKPWVLYGLAHRLTEKVSFSKKEVGSVSHIFKKSLHVFPIDVSNDNSLNFEIAALESPQYNPHRFGIFFTDSPRHADVLLVLGKVSPEMKDPLYETVNQIPEPFGVVILENPSDVGESAKDMKLPNVVGYFNGDVSAKEILDILRSIMEG